MLLVENLTPFVTEFGTVATLDGALVRGIFDRDYVQAFDGIASTSPQFVLPSASATTATTSSLLVVAGSSYRVRSVQPDGTGMTSLTLERS